MIHRTETICRLLLVVVLAAAFAIRLRGIMFGYPLPVHPDEPRLVETALGMLKTGDLNPHFFNYPTLNIYLQALLYRGISVVSESFTLAASINDVPIITFYLWGRALTVVLSTATIAITYAIGSRLIHPVAGLASACFVGASYLHITNSFTITVDAPVAFWSALSVLMATLIYVGQPKLRYYLLAGLFAGLAISSKYTAFLVAAPLILAHLLQARRSEGWIDHKIVIGLLIIPIAFVLTTPYALLDQAAFMNAIRAEGQHYREGHPGNESLGARSFGEYASYLMVEGYGLPALLPAAVGLLWLLIKDWKKALFLLSFPLLLFLFVGQYKTWFSRNIVATVPFLALFSGIGVYFLSEWLRQRLPGETGARPRWARAAPYIAAAALIVASVYGQVIRSAADIRLLTLPDTRWVALQWIEGNLPPGIRIGREHYTPPIEEFTARHRATYLGYFAVLHKMREIGLQDYMIVSSLDHERYVDNPTDYPEEARAYQTFFAANELVQEWVPDDKTLGGPTIRLYKLMR